MESLLAALQISSNGKLRQSRTALTLTNKAWITKEFLGFFWENPGICEVSDTSGKGIIHPSRHRNISHVLYLEGIEMLATQEYLILFGAPEYILAMLASHMFYVIKKS